MRKLIITCIFINTAVLITILFLNSYNKSSKLGNNRKSFCYSKEQ